MRFSPASRLERSLFWGGLALLGLPLMFVKGAMWIEGSADSAMLVEITENVAATGVPTSRLVPGILAFIDRGLSVLPADQADKVDLSLSEPTFNVFKRHAYIILYLIAPFSWLIPAPIIWSVLTVWSFLGLPALTYLFLRRSAVPAFCAILFCFLVTFHPAWSESLYRGQIYADRLFLLFGGLFIFEFVRPDPRKTLIGLWGILGALVVERTGLVLGAFAVGTTFLYWRDRRGLRLFGLLVGVALAAYSWIVIKAILDNGNYESFMPGSISEAISRFSSPGFSEKLGVFALYNLGMLGVFAVFSPRALVLAAGVALPNVFGTIGGAEKVGWSTHYHTIYLPFLLWAAADGYRRVISAIDGSSRPRLFRATACIIIAGMIILFGGRDPYAMGAFDSHSLKSIPKNNACIQMIERFPRYIIEKRRKSAHAIYDRLQEIIPTGAMVSGPEYVFPALCRRNAVHLFPIGLDHADFAMMDMMYFGGTEERNRLEKALRERMARAGYDMDHPMMANQVRVYRRHGR